VAGAGGAERYDDSLIGKATSVLSGSSQSVAVGAAGAVIREVREELGLDGTIAGFVGNYSFFEMHQLILAFHVSASGRVTLGEELAEVRYVAPDRLKPWPFGTGPAVKDWLEKRTA
jgi:8-oxo-dGTP pyrophosphatase MutT (NUDIX family)